MKSFKATPEMPFCIPAHAQATYKERILTVVDKSTYDRLLSAIYDSTEPKIWNKCRTDAICNLNNLDNYGSRNQDDRRIVTAIILENRNNNHDLIWYLASTCYECLKQDSELFANIIQHNNNIDYHYKQQAIQLIRKQHENTLTK
jgi:hypothetical protein